MKSKFLLLLSILTALGALIPLVAQENDDMYFSREDREELYASTSFASQTSNYNVAEENGKTEGANNQYFVKDYSIKNKTDNEIKTYSGINSTNGFNSGFNVMLSFGSFYNSPYSNYGYYNPCNDPFSPYYDPFYRYRRSSYYASYRYNPWGYNNYYNYTNGFNSYNNGYYNSSNVYATTSYSNNVRDEVRYRNGRKIITKSRTSRTGVRPTERPSNGRAIKNAGSKVSTNGRSSGTKSRSTYRRYSNGTQNRSSNSNSRSNNTSINRSRSNSSGSNINRSSGSSSPGSRSTYSSGSSRSRSTSGSSSGSSRSSGSRGRGN